MKLVEDRFKQNARCLHSDFKTCINKLFKFRRKKKDVLEKNDIINNSWTSLTQLGVPEKLNTDILT